MLQFKRAEAFDLTLAYADSADVPGHRDVIGKYRVGGVQPDANGEPMKIKVRF